MVIFNSYVSLPEGNIQLFRWPHLSEIMMNYDNLSRLDTSWMGGVVCSIVIFSYCRVVFV
jgi:hypothetical protein